MRRPLKITYLSPTGQVGGAEISMLDVISRLSPERFTVTVILLDTGPLEQRLKNLNTGYRALVLPRLMRGLSRARHILPHEYLLLPFLAAYSAWKLRRLILSESPDVVISNGLKCHLLSALAKLRTRARLIWHVRDALSAGPLRWLLRSVGGLSCDLVIANSSAVARTTATGRTVAIHNGIDLCVFNSRALPLDKEKDLGLPPDAHVVGTVAHLAPVKGLDTLIHAAGTIIRQLPSAHFVIAGAAIYQTHREYEGELKRLVKANGLEGRVHFLGYRQDVPALLATFDAFVLPSRSEGFGRAVAEAQAVGCPVVASDVGGVSEIVSDGETGLLIQPNEPESLAKAVVRLAKDLPLRNRLVQEARRSVRRRFGLDKQAELLESAVMSIIEGRPFDPASRADAGERGRRSHPRRGIRRLPAYLRGVGGASVRKSLRPSPSSGTEQGSALHSGH